MTPEKWWIKYREDVLKGPNPVHEAFLAGYASGAADAAVKIKEYTIVSEEAIKSIMGTVLSLEVEEATK